MSKHKPHLLVDGYNAIFSLYKGKSNQSMSAIEGKIDALIDDLVAIFKMEDTRVSIVLDGQGRNIDIQRPFNDPEFSLIYCAGTSSADAVIQALVENSKKPATVTVATNDNALTNACAALGAETISINFLQDWIKSCQEKIHRQLSKNSEQKNSSFGNKLDL